MSNLQHAIDAQMRLAATKQRPARPKEWSPQLTKPKRVDPHTAVGRLQAAAPTLLLVPRFHAVPDVAALPGTVLSLVSEQEDLVYAAYEFCRNFGIAFHEPSKQPVQAHHSVLIVEHPGIDWRSSKRILGHAFEARDKLDIPIFHLDLGEAKSLDPKAWRLEENVELPTKSWLREFFRKHMIPFTEETEDAQAKM